MTAFLAVFAIAFFAILIVELPDKTLVATLVLSTRYSVRPVLAGVSAAFAVQCAIAVTAGGLLRLLNHRVLEVLVALLFALGAVLLFRESRESREPDQEQDAASAAEDAAVPPRRVFFISFGVLFAAEWGDASQLATAALVARYGQPLATGLGAFLALTTVATIATFGGKFLITRVPLHLIQRVGAAVFALFAVIAAVSALGG